MWYCCCCSISTVCGCKWTAKPRLCRLGQEYNINAHDMAQACQHMHTHLSFRNLVVTPHTSKLMPWPDIMIPTLTLSVIFFCITYSRAGRSCFSTQWIQSTGQDSAGRQAGKRRLIRARLDVGLHERRDVWGMSLRCTPCAPMKASSSSAHDNPVMAYPQTCACLQYTHQWLLVFYPLDLATEQTPGCVHGRAPGGKWQRHTKHTDGSQCMKTHPASSKQQVLRWHTTQACFSTVLSLMAED